MSTDDTFYENGINRQPEETQYNDKQWVYALDQNAGVYSSGQVQFDLSSFTNGNGYYNWSEGYLVVPLVATVQCSSKLSNQCDFALAMKNGYYQLINSCSIKIGNNDVNNRTEYTNMHINYKVLTSLSHNDLLTMGTAIGVWPDSALSGQYSGPDAGQGNPSLKNNVVNLLSSLAVPAIAAGAAAGAPAIPALNFFNTGTTYRPRSFNEGLYRRALSTSFNPVANNNFNGLVTTAQLQNNYRNYTEPITVPAANPADPRVVVGQVYYMQAVIRLKDIHDVFSKMNMPISSAYVRLILNLNVGSSVVTIGSRVTNSFNRVTSSSVSGQTLPIMMTDVITDKPDADGDTMTVNVAVSKVGNFSNGFGSCRVYLPLYQMNPLQESKYLDVKKIRITYNDVYQYSILNNKGGTTINQILSNGIANMKKLIIIPILSAQSNAGFSPLQSCLATEPGTPSMQMSLSKLNVTVSGKNIYQQNIDYDFEEFIHQVRPSNNINGGLYDGLSCGLIGQLEWTNQYRYYVVDLSRRVPSEEGIAKSLQLMCQINVPNDKFVDLYCFVEFQKEFDIDSTSGEVTLQ